MDSIERRLAALERESLRWRCLALALGVIVLAGAAGQMVGLDAPELVLTDREGKPSVVLSGDRRHPVIEARDSQGRVRLEAWILDDGVTVDLKGKDGKSALSLSTTDGQGGSIHLRHPNGRTGAIIRPEE